MILQIIKSTNLSENFLLIPRGRSPSFHLFPSGQKLTLVMFIDKIVTFTNLFKSLHSNLFEN